MTLPTTLMNGWGQFRPLEAFVQFPRYPEEAMASDGYGTHPRGRGRSYGDAGLPASGYVSVDTRFLDNFIDFDGNSGVLTTEPGVTLQQILRDFVPKGYFLPVTPGTMFVSLGGAVASNVHGKNHHCHGSIEHFIEGMQVQTPKELLWCSRNETPELFNATVGGYGLTGLIRQIKLKLLPIETSYIKERTVRSKNLEGLFRLFKEEDGHYPYSVAWIDALARGKAMGRGVLMLGRHAERNDLTGKEKENYLSHTNSKKGSVPVNMPSFFCNSFNMKAFNYLFYKKSRDHAGVIKNYESFFYPLDRLLNWNRMYGKSGFLQYQCCVPDPHSEEGISKCLEFLTDRKLGSFLSVLKRCGDDTVALPFCKKGYTLALDIPYRSEKTLEHLDELDKLVIEYNGKVYLTKDARLSPEAFRAMYPEFPRWMRSIKKYNPDGKSSSRLAERLELWKL
ncbi:FAD-dependent oxidoreductase [Fibrobacterota bacterium]